MGLNVRSDAYIPHTGKTASWHVIVQKSHVAMCTAVTSLKVWYL